METWTIGTTNKIDFINNLIIHKLIFKITIFKSIGKYIEISETNLKYKMTNLNVYFI